MAASRPEWSEDCRCGGRPPWSWPLAERPAAQGNWANADDWLPETFRAVTPDDVLAEAAGRKVSTLARLGYLAEWSGRDDVADEVEALLPGRLPVIFLGPRDRRDRLEPPLARL